MASFEFLKAAWGIELTPEAQQQVEEQAESLSRKHIEEYLKDTDIRKFGIRSDLPKDVSRLPSLPPGKFLVQVGKIADITQPARFQEEFEGGKWRLLCLDLADNEQKFRAIEYGPVKVLGVHLPPGTKLLLWSSAEHPLRIQNGHLLLTEHNVEVLGGNVEKLTESWRASREVEANRMLWRTEGIKKTDKADAAPPWVDFDPKKAPRAGASKALEAERAEWRKTGAESTGVTLGRGAARSEEDGGARFQVQDFVSPEADVAVKTQVSSAAFQQAPSKGKGKGKWKDEGGGGGKGRRRDDWDGDGEEKRAPVAVSTLAAFIKPAKKGDAPSEALAALVEPEAPSRHEPQQYAQQQWGAAAAESWGGGWADGGWGAHSWSAGGGGGGGRGGYGKSGGGGKKGGGGGKRGSAKGW